MSALTARLKDFLGQPFVKAFLTDAIETGAAAVVALNVAVPLNLDQAKASALVIGAAIGGAIISAARRRAPDFLAYVRSKLGVGGA